MWSLNGGLELRRSEMHDFYRETKTMAEPGASQGEWKFLDPCGGWLVGPFKRVGFIALLEVLSGMELARTEMLRKRLTPAGRLWHPATYAC